ncbi:hypothetical protein DV515_00002759 [Chloebia gouldiae]|uniref:Uncharacterized protein n=1 Tax=Chloebia gouldiae TaxID=44316 RepID=A0A3L8SUZ0_CHLGU|nr:hypothetical protein DV515_00002759 [Chloebia gouldiae]
MSPNEPGCLSFCLPTLIVFFTGLRVQSAMLSSSMRQVQEIIEKNHNKGIKADVLRRFHKLDKAGINTLYLNMILSVANDKNLRHVKTEDFTLTVNDHNNRKEGSRDDLIANNLFDYSEDFNIKDVNIVDQLEREMLINAKETYYFCKKSSATPQFASMQSYPSCAPTSSAQHHRGQAILPRDLMRVVPTRPFHPPGAMAGRHHTFVVHGSCVKIPQMRREDGREEGKIIFSPAKRFKGPVTHLSLQGSVRLMIGTRQWQHQSLHVPLPAQGMSTESLGPGNRFMTLNGGSEKSKESMNEEYLMEEKNKTVLYRCLLGPGSPHLQQELKQIYFLPTTQYWKNKTSHSERGGRDAKKLPRCVTTRNTELVKSNLVQGDDKASFE